MTKQDIIKQEWHKIDSSIDVTIGDKNGEIYKKNIPLNSLKKNIENGNLIPKCNGYFLPKSLEGIENNNGWKKIESENDLPNDSNCFYFYMEGGKYYNTTPRNLMSLKDTYNFLKSSNKPLTHYQPIQKPKPPIY